MLYLSLPLLTTTTTTVTARCCTDGQYEQAVGLALEARRLDWLRRVVSTAPDAAALLSYALRVTQRLVVNRDFRQQVRLLSTCPPLLLLFYLLYLLAAVCILLAAVCISPRPHRCHVPWT